MGRNTNSLPSGWQPDRCMLSADFEATEQVDHNVQWLAVGWVKE